jgi:Undecaprenyl-phosphate glucose phosphotransferase
MTALPASSSERRRQRVVVALLRRLPVNYDAFGFTAIPSDVFSVLLAGVLTAGGYDLIAFGRIQTLRDCWQLGAILAGFTLVLMYFKGFYDSDRLLSTPSQIVSIASVWGTAFLFAFAVCSGLDAKGAFYHGWVPSFAIAAPALILAHRLLLQHLLASALDQGWIQCKHILVITDAAGSFQKIQNSHEIVRIHPLPPNDRLGEFREQIAGTIAGEHFIDEVHIAIDWTNWSRGKQVLRELDGLPMPVRLIADANATEILRYRQHVSGGIVRFELQRAPLTLGGRIAKRLFDVAVAGLGLLVLAPLLAAVAVAIRIDSPGPIFFRQKRGGFNGRAFQILKFRTMRVLEDGPWIKQATQHDDRVTRVGSFLRWSSLDELPQLINVLRGDMSLVGPRPHALAHDDAYRSLISSYPFRHFVKPGITGWAQVNGFRGETPTLALMKQRIELDLWYARNWSFWLDLWILIGTVREVCRPRNAF